MKHSILHMWDTYILRTYYSIEHIVKMKSEWRMKYKNLIKYDNLTLCLLSIQFSYFLTKLRDLCKFNDCKPKTMWIDFCIDLTNTWIYCCCVCSMILASWCRWESYYACHCRFHYALIINIYWWNCNFVYMWNLCLRDA